MNDNERPAPPGPPQVYTIAELGAAYRISRNRIFDEMKAGRLAAKRVGGRVLVSRDDAQAWWNALPNRQAA